MQICKSPKKKALHFVQMKYGAPLIVVTWEASKPESFPIWLLRNTSITNSSTQKHYLPWKAARKLIRIRLEIISRSTQLINKSQRQIHRHNRKRIAESRFVSHTVE